MSSSHAPPKAARPSRLSSRHVLRHYWPALAALLLCLAYAMVVQLVWDIDLLGLSKVSHGAMSLAGALPGHGRNILVLYVFANTDPEFLGNLQYFVREAVMGDKRCDYVIAVQQGSSIQEVELPELPPHAKYVHHSHQCYDWGIFGWLLSSSHVSLGRYRYFLFVNSSVRGPFLPSYARGKLHWTDPLIGKLVGDVKLVGPTISCEGSPLDGDQQGIWRRNPHVQSYTVATDWVGLGLLRDDRRVFRCHRDRWNTIYYSELGSSAAILDAGYNLDCLMARYQGVNWRDRSNWDCNQRMAPVAEYTCDGISLDPMEVVFVKVKSHMLDAELSTAKLAARYTRWQQESDRRRKHESARRSGSNALQVLGLQAANTTASVAAVSGASIGSNSSSTNGSASLESNQYLAELPRFKTPRVLEMRARGGRCFDFDYYLSANPELLGVVGESKEEVWRHFVYYGQFEARPFRFFCESVDYDKLVTWY